MNYVERADGVFVESPISRWFELSYAQFLTVPRLVMESMPLEWQEKMASLLQEMDETFDWRPSEGRYWVRLRKQDGSFAEAPLGDYRRGSVEHLRRATGTPGAAAERAERPARPSRPSASTAGPQGGTLRRRKG